MVRFALLLSLGVWLFATDLKEPSVFDMMERGREDKLVNKPIAPATTPTPPAATKPQPKPSAPLSIDEINQIKGFVPTDEPDLGIPDSQVYDPIKKRDLIIKALNSPKSVFVGEIFKIELVADTQSDLDFEFESSVDESQIKWLNSKNTQWVRNNDGKYIAVFYLQAKSTNAKSVRININLKRNGEVHQSGGTNIFLPKFKELRAKSDFNQIVADSLEVKKFKTTKFDDNALIMIVELYGKNVDLGSFRLEDKTLLKQGVDTIVGDFGSQSAYYFAVFKPNKRTIDFSYYNLKNAKFESFSLPVSVEDDEISTQIGLNPKQSEFSTYKNVTLYALSVIFLLATLIRRKFSYLIATSLLIAASVYTYNPLSKGVLKPDVNVKILPTERSTIFYTSHSSENIEILDTHNDYVKILFSDGKIGWVRSSDVSKN